MRDLVVLGAGGHARVLQESLELLGRALTGFIALTADSRLAGVRWMGGDSALSELDPARVLLVNGVGSTRSSLVRESLYENALRAGFEFLTVVDRRAVVRLSAIVGTGSQILAAAVVNSGADIGHNSIVNTGAIIEHDCRIGSSVHVSPGATLGGDVTVGNRSHVGLGAIVLQGVSIGSDCTIGAGAVVTRDVPDGAVAVGIPAKWHPHGEWRG